MSEDKNGRRLRVRERRRYTEEFADEELHEPRAFDVGEKLESDRFQLDDVVEEMLGHQLTMNYLQENGFEKPILIKQMHGLGMKIPSKSFTISDVKQCVGSRRILDVMDVETQRDFNMTMKEWCNYYNSQSRDRLLNVISLEFSHTKLETLIESPSIVRQVDWVDWVWPRHLKQMQTEGTNAIEEMKYPKVQKYCLMSVKGCYTDFHIDFGGTSVWYHILKGKKVFWLIPPSERNIQLYEQWVLSGKQSDIFFGDTVDQCSRIYLEDGNTFFIPTGWIHAVYTPEDSLVFGGNFLHSFGIEKQLRVAQVEDITKVPSKFRYPFYTEVLWYVLARYVFCLMGKNHLNCNEDGSPLKKDETDNGNNEKSGIFFNGNKQNEKSHVNLTQFELNGLKAIIMWLSRLAPSKRSLPELIVSAESLLNDAKVLIDEHSRDNHKLAITGKPCLFWSPKESKESPKKQTSGQSIASQLRQFKKEKKIPETTTTTTSITSHQPSRPESPPTRPISSNQYRINVGTTITQADLIPSSFAGLIAATGMGNINGSFNPPPRTTVPIVGSIPQMIISVPAAGYLTAQNPLVQNPLVQNPLPPPPPLISVNNYSIQQNQIQLNQSQLQIQNQNQLQNQMKLNQQTSLLNDSRILSNTSTQTNFAQDLSMHNQINHHQANQQHQASQLQVNQHVNQQQLNHQMNHQVNQTQMNQQVAQPTQLNQVNQTNQLNHQQVNQIQKQKHGYYQSNVSQEKFSSSSSSSSSSSTSTSTSTQVQTQTQTQTMHFPVAVPPSGFHQEKGTSTVGQPPTNTSLNKSTISTSERKSSANDNSRRRRTRCKKCESCLRADCGECHFCKDMKKFGGPGRMKQSCIARQCMAPVLPHTACCMICGRDGWEKLNIQSIQLDGQSISDDAASSLMECSQCWEIVHPFCLGEKYSHEIFANSSGNINNDLPNSWECPRCVKNGKMTNGQGSKSKAKTQTPVSIGTSTTTSSNVKEEPLTLTSPKRMKLDDSPPSTEDERNDKDEDEDTEDEKEKSLLNHSSSAHVRSCSRFPLLSQGIKAASTSTQSSSQSKNEGPKGLSALALSLSTSNKRKSESSRDRLFKSLKGLKKNEMLRTNQLKTNKTKGQHQSGHSSSSNSSSSISSPSYQTIEPKNLNDDESTEDEDQEQINLLVAKLNKNNKNNDNHDDNNNIDNMTKDDETNESYNGSNGQSIGSYNGHDNGSDNKIPKLIVKELIKPKYVVRPAPLQEDISSETETEEDGEEDLSEEEVLKKQKLKLKKKHLKKFYKKNHDANLVLNRDAIAPVFHWLTQSDISNCMLVCKLWNRWCCDPQLWRSMDLTRKKITSSCLIGIVRRQPQHLNLSWTNISKKQLSWLIARLPNLIGLSMAGCSSQSLSALSSINCPFLRHLDLSWCDGIDDELVRDLLSTPSDTRPGVEQKNRLRFLQEISFAGSGISDVSIRLISHQLPQLTHIDLSHCHKITDFGINALTKAYKLIKLNLSSCSLISDTSLDHLRRCPSLNYLDMRECHQVTSLACNKFVNSMGKKFILKECKLMEVN